MGSAYGETPGTGQITYRLIIMIATGERGGYYGRSMTTRAGTGIPARTSSLTLPGGTGRDG